MFHNTLPYADKANNKIITEFVKKSVCFLIVFGKPYRVCLSVPKDSQGGRVGSKVQSNFSLFQTQVSLQHMDPMQQLGLVQRVQRFQDT